MLNTQRFQKLFLLGCIGKVEIRNRARYLPDQFMSAPWDKQNDEYGGDLDGRMRFPLELISEVRNGVGVDFPIGFRLGIDLKLEGAHTRGEGLEICRRVEAAGVNVLSIDQGCGDSYFMALPTC